MSSDRIRKHTASLLKESVVVLVLLLLLGLLLLLLGGDLGRLSGGLLFLRNFGRGLFGGLNLSLFLFGFLKLFLDLIGVDREIVDDDLGTDREIENK